MEDNGYYLVLIADNRVPPLLYKSIKPNDLQEGSLVIVPYRKKQKIGMILDLNPKIDIPHEKIKHIDQNLGININQTQRKFLYKSQRYYLGELSSFFKMVAPIEYKECQYDNKKIETSQFNLSTLSTEQNVALEKLVIGYKNDISKPILIDGITGSGKTEIYFHLIAKILKEQDSQILIILPEIVLTDQLVQKFYDRFYFMPTLWHSSVSKVKKNKEWQKIVNGDARVVIGARSALYLPFKNLKLLIVEEEHDSSYKQEDNVIYNARDMAVLKSHIENIFIILVSATPSIETYQNVVSQKYDSVVIKNRYKNITLPKVSIIDMKTQSFSKSKWLSDQMLDSLLTEISLGNQALLFLNRRGYAPITLCKKCGEKFECQACNSTMVWHKSKKRIECHHCGNMRGMHNIKCYSCNSVDSLIGCGPGVEKIEEDIKKHFPQIRVLVLTGDHIKSQSELKKTILKITNHEVDLIIGTQIIAKGHNFPKLKIVGVIDADISFSSGDLRGNEKTYQLLEQVRGRAGRNSNDSKALIQTYNPNNKILNAIINNERNDFYKYELETRSVNNMPPFYKIAIITVSDIKKDRAESIVNQIVRHAPIHKNVSVFGPSEGYPFYLRKKYRYKAVIKSSKKFNLQNYIEAILSQINLPSAAKIKIDIDPYSFL